MDLCIYVCTIGIADLQAYFDRLIKIHVDGTIFFPQILALHVIFTSLTIIARNEVVCCLLDGWHRNRLKMECSSVVRMFGKWSAQLMLYWFDETHFWKILEQFLMKKNGTKVFSINCWFLLDYPIQPASENMQYCCPPIKKQGDYEMSTVIVCEGFCKYCVLKMSTLANLLTAPTYFDGFWWYFGKRILV